MEIKKTLNPKWSKAELKTYILLLCANADQNESGEEIEHIKSQTEIASFESIYKEFSDDNEDEALEKIDSNIQLHEFSSLELSSLKRDIRSVFLIDESFTMKEANIDRILDNIIY